ncbi:MAG: universal stress protein [Promethearchaeota archaeon]
MNLFKGDKPIFDKILIGIDDSDEAIRAVNRVIEIQKGSEGKVVAFHSVLHQLSSSKRNNLISKGKGVLSKVGKMFKEANISFETRLIEDKDPEDYIEKIAESENFNLVVLGNAGEHKSLKTRLLGSIPTRVMNTISVDVLVVK